jgi:hypothetical protein
MARTCRFNFGGRSGAAEWSFDGTYLVVSPDDGAPLSFPVKELTGIAGDGYTVRASAGSDEVLLSHLGHEGPTLLDSLHREWLGARVEVLHLGGSGEGWPAHGQIAGLGSGVVQSGGASAPAGVAEPFTGLLFEDVLVVAREGRDLEPLFLALAETAKFDDATYAVHVREWPGREVVFSKLAKETDEFVNRLRANRSILAEEAAATLMAKLPSLQAGPRGALAGAWMPGRLLDPARMNALCPGFDQAFRGEWLPGLLRHEEGEHLLDWASPGSAWLGCTREAAEGAGAESDADPEAGSTTGTAAGTGEAGSAGESQAGAAAERPLWLLCGKDGVWFLEALTLEDRATYCFAGGEEVPALVSSLLCAPQFSREALYSPLAELAGDKADLAIPARSLGFLVELRARFRERVIHQSGDGWRKGIDKAAEA